MLQKALETTSADWIFHPGADAIVTRPEESLQSLLWEAGSKDLIASHCSRFGMPLYHLFRVNEWTRAFVARWWEIGPCHEHLWDAAAFAAALRDPGVDDHVAWITPGRIAVYPGEWKPGDFLMHVGGHTSIAEKIRCMKEVFPQ